MDVIPKNRMPQVRSSRSAGEDEYKEKNMERPMGECDSGVGQIDRFLQLPT